MFEVYVEDPQFSQDRLNYELAQFFANIPLKRLGDKTASFSVKFDVQIGTVFNHVRHKYRFESGIITSKSKSLSIVKAFKCGRHVYYKSERYIFQAICQ